MGDALGGLLENLWDWIGNGGGLGLWRCWSLVAVSMDGYQDMVEIVLKLTYMSP